MDHFNELKEDQERLDALAQEAMGAILSGGIGSANFLEKKKELNHMWIAKEAYSQAAAMMQMRKHFHKFMAEYEEQQNAEGS